MLIRYPNDIASSEITPPDIYRERRRFMQGVSALAAGAVLGISPEAEAGAKLAGVRASAYRLDEDRTPYKDVTTYNNFYEFGTGKGDPSENAGSLKTRPWTVAVEGEVANPKTYDIDALLKLAPLEERVYRMRCVEGWSIPHWRKIWISVKLPRGSTRRARCETAPLAGNCPRFLLAPV